MSADRQRLKSAIQRIAKEDPEIRGLLGGSQNKGGKASSAGVGVSDAERDRICCDGATSGSANPGTDEREPGESQSGLDSNDPADIGGGSGTLSGVTDCATGEPVCFEGSGFIPPDGWDAPNDPPTDPGYVENQYFESGSTSTKRFGLTCCEAASKYVQEFIIKTSGTVTGCDTNSAKNVVVYYTDTDSGSDGELVQECNIISCDSIYRAEYCEDIEPPEESHWPEDGCTNLAIVGGKIVGSKYDPENDGSYSAPRDSIDLCSGGDQISLAPAANGGWKTINSTTNNGYLYDSSGKQIAHIDGNEYSDPSV